MEMKIYFGDKPVYLCDALSAHLQELLHHPDTVFVDEMTSPAINALLHEIKKESFHAGVLLHGDFEKLRKAFFKHFILVQAGGGAVLNEKKQVLLIFRLGKWDLPKGKLDKGEDLAACALREVEEETGLSNVTLDKAMGCTYHTYDQFGKHILKETHWYRMNASSSMPLVPQTEEGIERLEWGGKKNLPLYLSNTYPSIADMLEKVWDG
jgi:8-oxo-dGTP pyrophosphatase MutT (NUDIX family)